jgi:L-iditol 2-dehydrogenase/galactitol-1-phosphate 5-dehydrogenase
VNQIGEFALSSGYDYFGSRRDGAFEEYVAVPEFNLFRVPDSLPLLAAAMVEPCAVAYHAAARPEVAPGAKAAVIGGGPIGLMVAQWLKIRGCSSVYVSEMDPRKRELAEQLGLVPVDAGGDPVSEIRERTGGGADLVVEACGLPITFRQALSSARLFGQVVFLGNIHGTFELPEKEFSSILRRELTIYGTWNSKITPRGNDEWTRVLNAMEKQIHVLPLVSDVVPIDRAPEMLGDMDAKSRWFNKVILELNTELPEGERG